MAHYSGLNDVIDEIWLLEPVNHGDSALLNEGRLGNICEAIAVSLPARLTRLS